MINEKARNDPLLAMKDSNLETRVLQLLEHSMSMKTIECLCHIVLARNCTVNEDRPITRM
jgi:hypothetical protein